MHRVLLRLVPALAACSAYDTDLGPAPFLCGPAEPRCPKDYTCVEEITTGDEVCVSAGGGGTGDFDCHDDSAYEPNDTIAMSSMATLTNNTLTIENLAICPGRDKDHFTVAIPAGGGDIEIVVTYELGGAMLKASILNAGGIPIASGTPVTGMAGTIRAAAQNLPGDNYYAQVAGPTDGALLVNNYKLTINTP
jgi:hypothetical protein